jgi:hypothetical protein
MGRASHPIRASAAGWAREWLPITLHDQNYARCCSGEVLVIF